MRNHSLVAVLVAALGGVLMAACGGGADPDAAPRIDARIPAGRYMASWTVNGLTGQAACDAVGAETVGIDLMTLNGSPGASDSFACSSFMGESQEHIPREYRFTFALRGGGHTLAEITLPDPIEIVDGQTATVPPVDFTVSTTGGFSLILDANAPGLNCDPETAMPQAGAGITEWGIELRTPPTGGTCVPLQIDVGQSTITPAAPSGTFDLVCPGFTMLPCFENDQLITFNGLAPATYVFDIRGFEGANACYIKTSQVDVVGGDIVDDLGMVLIVLDLANMSCVSP